jgi:hypothetical protein
MSSKARQLRPPTADAEATRLIRPPNPAPTSSDREIAGPSACPGVWGVKIQFASREPGICGRNAGFETPHPARKDHHGPLNSPASPVGLTLPERLGAQPAPGFRRIQWRPRANPREKHFTISGSPAQKSDFVTDNDFGPLVG